MSPVLLITVSLSAEGTPHVAVRDIEERTLRHLEALIAWIEEPGFPKIVFAKNCRVPVRSEVLTELAAKSGKDLECVQVDSSPKTSLQGKGFGEGDLVRQAIETSDLLRDSEEFVKITGKLHAPGILQSFEGTAEGEFFVTRAASPSGSARLRSHFYKSEEGSHLMGFLKRRLRIPWSLVSTPTGSLVDTRCYRVRKDFYSTVLSRSHLRVQDALGYTLERSFWDDLSRESRVRLIDGEPSIIGTSGSLGTRFGEFSDQVRIQAGEVSKALLSR
jgi:hypothetical protein